VPHLYLALSGHGLGHLAQVAPVVNALGRQLPRLTLTVQTALPREKVATRIRLPFSLIADPPDVGMVMDGPLRVLRGASLRAHYAFHADWNRRLRQQIGHLERVRPDLILADIPYLILAAARQAGLPAVALCSLNWADILSAYGNGPELDRLAGSIRETYQGADLFLRPDPSMPMADLANARSVGPVAEVGRDRRGELIERFPALSDRILVAALFGGIPTTGSGVEIPMPRDGGVALLAPRSWQQTHPSCYALEDLGMSAPDVLASVHAALVKPGYGTYVEAACVGTPLLCLPRPDWPETPYLTRWLQRVGRMGMLPPRPTASQLETLLRVTLESPSKAPVQPSGVAEATASLRNLLA
jgi:hypothetical protein